MNSQEKPDTFGAIATRKQDDLAWIAYLGFNFMIFIGLVILAFASMTSISNAPTGVLIKGCGEMVSPSPHEQQPEPIPAVTQGGIDVERWVL